MTIPTSPLDPQKFQNPFVTAKGETRAHVDFEKLQTLWFNTGSLCNIECANCYIASSPTADHFVYLTDNEVRGYLEDVDALTPDPIEIGITGGEPMMNPEIIDIMQSVLERGHTLLILTNAMKPLMRPRVMAGLLDVAKAHGQSRITFRVSLDHYTQAAHDAERQPGSFQAAITGMNWLAAQGFALSIAGRMLWGETEAEARAGYAKLIAENGWNIDAADPAQTVLFPEMDASVDVPEITTACWDILGQDPRAMMCSSSRMVVKRKGSDAPAVLACTLLWEDTQFELGRTLSESLKSVQLNHPHCAKFCVLGGASCSAD